MGMVNCHGCGKAIHDTAPMCPNCGAPNVNQSQGLPSDKLVNIHYINPVGGAYVPQPPGVGLSTASVVLGIIALCFLVPSALLAFIAPDAAGAMFVGCGAILGLPLATVGLILGIVGIMKLKAAKMPHGRAFAGILINGIPIAGAILLLLLSAIGLAILRNHADDARRIKAYDQMRQVQNGLAEHYMRYGYYPELGSWEAMISASSPLLIKNFIPVNIPVNDPWGQPFEGKSEKTKFELKCLGRPDKGADLGPIVMNQDRTIGAPGEVQADEVGDQRVAPAPLPYL